jgi:mechanosensitive ion channel protein 1/2/3
MPNGMLVTGLCVDMQSGHAGRIIEGIIMDIGWYRTLIRSFEREVYIVPNSVFSRTVVLNVTRKGKEWRVFENIGVRVEDISAVPMIISDMRRIIRDDVRVLPKLHRRVFLDKVNRNELTIYISFYIEAANRDAYMATKQEIFLEFAMACERHGAQLASNRHQVCCCLSVRV